MTRTLNPLRLFAEALLILAGVELLIMETLARWLPTLSGITESITDALLLALLAGPLLVWRIQRMLAPPTRAGEVGFAETEQGSHPWRWSALVLLIGLSLTAWRATELADTIRQRAAERFELQVRQLETDIALRFKRPEQPLRGARGLFEAYPDADRLHFQQWLASRDLQSELPGLRGIGFIQPVVPGALDALIQRERRQGAPDFKLKGVAGAPLHPQRPYIIRFVEPRGANRGAIGLDIASEATRKAAADLAAQLGEPVLTGVITLVQDNKKRAGALLLLPIYRGGGTPETPEARLQALVGWVYSPLVYEELLAASRDAMHDLIAFAVTDTDASGKTSLVYQSVAGVPERPSRFLLTRSIRVGEQELRIEARSLPAFEAGFDWNEPLRLAIAGVVASCLVALSLWLLMTGRNRALVTAAELTASLRSAYRSMEVATQRMEIVIEASPFGILIVNAEGRIQMANPTAERIFGYSKDELITLPVEQLVPAAARDGHHSKMDNYRAAPTPRRMGANRRLSACRQDGSEIPVEVGLTPLRVGDEGTVLVTVLDISERARAEDELAHHRHQLEDLVRERTADAVRAKEAAERANAAKSVFLTNMSHELRTPLHAVLSFARLGQKRAADAGVPPKLAQYFDRISEGGERLLTLVSALIDLSALEQGQREFHFAPLALQSLLADALNKVQATATARSIRLRTELPDPALTATVDQAGMTDVLAQVLTNAISYSPVGDEVVISAALAPDAAEPTLRIDISDHGIGIPESERDKVFDAFVQSSSTETGAGGKGLGLAICREIVTAHGGRISAHANEGGGTRIRIALPSR